MAKIPEIDCSTDTRDENPTLRRLRALTCWYEDEARRNNLSHKGLKILSIGSAALIPVSVAASAPPLVGAVLGGVVVAFEGIQELFQFQKNWVTFGQTKEALKREKALFDARTAGYENADALQVLARRTESLVAAETASWAATTIPTGGPPGPKPS